MAVPVDVKCAATGYIQSEERSTSDERIEEQFLGAGSILLLAYLAAITRRVKYFAILGFECTNVMDLNRVAGNREAFTVSGLL
jgi:hypothetical protein